MVDVSLGGEPPSERAEWNIAGANDVAPVRIDCAFVDRDDRLRSRLLEDDKPFG